MCAVHLLAVDVESELVLVLVGTQLDVDDEPPPWALEIGMKEKNYTVTYPLQFDLGPLAPPDKVQPRSYCIQGNFPWILTPKEGL